MAHLAMVEPPRGNIGAVGLQGWLRGGLGLNIYSYLEWLITLFTMIPNGP